MSSAKQSPHLGWDVSTGYDLFMSLEVLHNPEHFGLRGSWAAGVRSRLPATERETLQQVGKAFLTKALYYWIYSLPAPKDGAAILKALEQTSPAERLRPLVLCPLISEKFLKESVPIRAGAKKIKKRYSFVFRSAK
jgi:hypothetical protein